MGAGSEGSFKLFTLFNTAIPLRQLLQMRAGFTPSPYEENNLIVFYLLDLTDITENQEMVVNQVTGSW